MSEIMMIILAYLAGGLVTASVMACVLKDRDDHLTDIDKEILLYAATFWPIFVIVGVIVAPVFAVIAISSALYEHVKWVRRLWDSLPDQSDLYPVEWFLCWPVKLYELWRERHERDSDSGMQKRRK